MDDVAVMGTSFDQGVATVPLRGTGCVAAVPFKWLSVKVRVPVILPD